jgi:hypothetical protein
MPLQVNVKRGILRLWIVFSIAWIGFAVLVTRDTLTSMFWLCWRWEGSVRNLTVNADCRLSAGPDIYQGRYVHVWAPDWHLVSNMIMFTIAPPILLFIAGIAVLWIFAGFRAINK